MENIDHMAAKSLEALSRDNLTDQGRKRLTTDILCGMATLACLAVGLLFTYVFTGVHPVVPQLLYFIGFLIEGIPVIFAGIKGIFTKNLTNAMEILVAIAIVACVLNRELILALLIPLILNVVHLLEERSIMGGRDVIENLTRMQQTTAVVLEGEVETVVDVKALKVGQHVLVKPGMGIPADGIVISGQSNIDQKSLTGEPQPAEVSTGDSVYAGTVNLDGQLVVEVKKEHVDTTFSKILQLLEQSEHISVPESRLIDRFLTYYIPFVLAVAAAVALVSGDVSQAVSILVVSCPCGQMLVSSAPMIAALSAATKRGVLIKNSKFIEELTEIETVVFDKTGTVTRGELSLTDAVAAEGFTKEQLLETAALLASASNHPVSRAVIRAVGKSQQHDLTVHEISGGGMECVTQEETLRFGRQEWLARCGVAIADDFCPEEAGSVSFVARDGVLMGCLCFNDTLRENAREAVLSLRELGVERTVILTGDREAPAEAIRQELAVDEVYARLLPQDKMEKLRLLSQDGGKVLVVGDGINDALALREATVGVAMGAMGSDLAIESADIALMNNNLENIPFAIRLARQTRRTIYENLVLSIGISAVMIALSAFGVINALAGSVLHNLGAFAVLLNSSRILKNQK